MFVFWKTERPHKRTEGTVRVTGLNGTKPCTQFPVCYHGDRRPSLSDVVCETPFSALSSFQWSRVWEFHSFLFSFMLHISYAPPSPSPPPRPLFFELHSAYSQAYNLTPPSSLTLSLHPLAKLPFRSRGNPLISQPQPLRLPRGAGPDVVWRGGATAGCKNPSNDCGLGFLQTLRVFPALSVWGLGKCWGWQWLLLILRFNANDIMMFIHMRDQHGEADSKLLK